MDELSNFGKQNNIPHWRLELKYYGPPGVIDAQWAHAKEKFSEIQGVQFMEDKMYTLPLSDADKEEIHKVSPRYPQSVDLFYRCTYRVEFGPG